MVENVYYSFLFCCRRAHVRNSEMAASAAVKKKKRKKTRSSSRTYTYNNIYRSRPVCVATVFFFFLSFFLLLLLLLPAREMEFRDYDRSLLWLFNSTQRTHTCAVQSAIVCCKHNMVAYTRAQEVQICVVQSFSYPPPSYFFKPRVYASLWWWRGGGGGGARETPSISCDSCHTALSLRNRRVHVRDV